MPSKRAAAVRRENLRTAAALFSPQTALTSHPLPLGKAEGTRTTADIHTAVVVVIVPILLEVVTHGDIACVGIDPAARQGTAELADRRRRRAWLVHRNRAAVLDEDRKLARLHMVLEV